MLNSVYIKKNPTKKNLSTHLALITSFKFIKLGKKGKYKIA